MGLQLRSDNFNDGDHLGIEHVGSEDHGFGCAGGNVSPALAWSGAPDATKSFAITCFDPDAPTDCGFWHWLLVNIPADVSSLPVGAGSGASLPSGALQLRTDYGTHAYGGPCPPEGDKAHRYVFTVYALGLESLPVDADTSAAVVSFNLNANALEKATLTGLYKR